MIETLKILGGFAFGLWFQAKVLQTPTVKNYFKRFKQKKGSDNIMTINNEKSQSGVITAEMTRKEVIRAWKQLQGK